MICITMLKLISIISFIQTYLPLIIYKKKTQNNQGIISLTKISHLIVLLKFDKEETESNKDVAKTGHNIDLHEHQQMHC